MRNNVFEALEPAENSELLPVKKKTEVVAMLVAGGIGTFCILLIFSIPTLSIVFSQVFPWQENNSVCDPKKFESVLNSSGVFNMRPVTCTCREDFPTFLFIEGVLEIITLTLLLVFACCSVMSKDSEDTRGPTQKCKTAICVGCCALLVYVACFIITIMMLESMFSSNRKCGESLWWYGVFLCVFFGSGSLPLWINVLGSE
jgi:hypothetical protein